MKIAIVTDSTADLPRQLIEQWKIFVVPAKVCFGGHQYSEYDLSPEELYARLATATELPKTSQPSPEEFSTVYRKALSEHEEVISIHVAALLTGTLNSARLAAESIADKVHLVDSRSISLGVGQMVLEAARAVKEGLSVGAVLDRIAKMRRDMEVFFTLDTLEYLHRGGRIGAVKGLLGSLLRIKSIIRVDESGVLVPVGIARSREKALDSMVAALENAAAGRTVKVMAVAHGAAADAAARLRSKLESAFGVKVSLLGKVGAAIGVHSGPGAVGASIVYA